MKSNLELHPKCEELDSKGEKCKRISLLGLCSYYLEPVAQWSRMQGCAGRTHNKGKSIEIQHLPSTPSLINPLKASKRAAKGKVQTSLKDMGVKEKQRKSKERSDSR